MTGTRGNGPRIPNRQNHIGLRGNLNTSGTTEGPSLMSGTTSIGVGGLNYVDLPPPHVQHGRTPQYWTIEKISIYFGFALAGISVIIFFYHMDSNIDVVKADVKEGKDKIEKLDEKANKQASATESIANSVQRLEGEIRRTQDYVHDRKR